MFWVGGLGMPDLNWKDVTEAAIFGGFALLGSVARTLSDNILKNRKKTGIALLALVATNGLVAGFCGMIIVPLSRIMHLDPYWALFLAGMSGWTGGVFLSALEKIALRRLGDATNDTTGN